MKHQIIFIFFFVLTIFTSCSKDSEYNDQTSIELSSRSSNNLSITMRLSDQSVITTSASVFSVSALNDGQFTIVVNNSTSYTATEVSITEANGTFKIIKNPGINQNVFNNVSQANIFLNSSNQLSFTLGGTTIHAANAIVGDENDGF